MDQSKDNLTVLLLHRPPREEEADAWTRFAKALKTLGQLETREVTEMPFTELFLASSSYSHVFLDLALADFAQLASSPVANLTLVKKDSFTWNHPRARELMGPALLKHSSLLLEDMAAADLVRCLHLFLSTKRLTGVTPLLEKGSVVIGEKVQSLESIGTMMDKLSGYLEKLEGFTLGSRVFELRQTLSALVCEALHRATESGQPYPTIDFQVGASKQKLVVNLRFPRGALELEAISAMAVEGEDFRWQQAWMSSDLFLVTQHVQYDELEVMVVLNRPTRSYAAGFRSFLTKRSERSPKKENLLSAPQNYEFQLLADIRVNQQDQLYTTADLTEDLSIDLGSLPTEVVKRLEKLSEENEFFREQTKKKDTLLREAITKISQANKDISQKRNELLRLVKAKDAQAENLGRKISELEKRVEQAQSSASMQLSAAKESAGSSPALQEAIGKLEAGLKAAENEKNQLLEKLTREEKKVTAFEQKYSALYKDLGQKDKELNEVKSMLIKARKEQSAALAAAAASSSGAGGSSAELAAKLKEADAKESAFKQEIRKMAFKIENHDKNVKAIQAESAEKTKLLEQKLQSAKAREVELLRKIEELSAALKKAAKAA